MLNRDALIAVRPLVDDLTYSGKEVSVKPESPLSALVGYTALPADMYIDSPTPVDGALTAEEAAMQKLGFAKNAGGVEIHNSEMNALTEKLIQMASANILFARKEINPVIRELNKEASIIREKAIGSDFADNMVRLYEVPAFFEGNIFDTLVSNYSQVKASRPNMNGLDIFSTLSIDELKSVLSTGLPAIDKQILEMVEESSTFSYLADSAFSVLNGEYKFGIGSKSNPYTEYGPLLIFLFLNGVLNGRAEGVNIDEQSHDIRGRLAQLRNHFAYILETQRTHLSLLENMEGFGIPTLSTEYEQAVRSKPYRKWIKDNDGASAEVYLAFLESKRPISALTEDIDGLVAFWKSREAMKLIKRKAEANVAINKYLVRGLSEKISEFDFEDDVKAEFNLKLNKLMATNKFVIGEDLHAFIRNLVCDVLAEGTDAKAILVQIDSELADNPELSPSDAACLAVCDLVANWIADQLSCEAF